MNVKKMDYEMEKFNQENVEIMLKNLGLDTNNYLISMTKPSVLDSVTMGLIADFFDRYCIVCFSETELNLIMTARINTKKVTELITINRDEISKIKMSNILVSYMLDLAVGQNKIKLQVFKKVAKYTKIKDSLEEFKRIYNL